MTDFATARKAMVDSQLHTSGVFDKRILTAMGAVPREAFVPPGRAALAYLDDHHILPGNRFLFSPSLFGRLVQLAKIEPSDSILDVGSATGYSTAVLSHLAEDVTAVEPDEALANTASGILASLQIGPVRTARDPTALGESCYDVIIVQDIIDATPTALLHRLRENGRLVAMIRKGRVGLATTFLANQGKFTSQQHFDAILPLQNIAPPAQEFVF